MTQQPLLLPDGERCNVCGGEGCVTCDFTGWTKLPAAMQTLKVEEISDSLEDIHDLDELPVKVARHKLLNDREYRNNISNCPVCGSNIQDRTVSLYKGLIQALYDVYCWCGKERRHEFDTKDIKHLLGKNEYARFGDLVRFGGLVYKREKAQYGLNMKRCKDFFHGDYKIPVQITLNQITNEIIDRHDVSVGEFPDLAFFLNERGLYDYEKEV